VPKQVVEIKSFHAGTVSTPEESDIPLDATPNSSNIEPVNVDGRLEGRPEDVTKLSSVNATAMVKVNNDGTNNVIYYDPSDDKLKRINDIDAGSPALSTLSSSAESSVDSPTMEVNNKEVHIGTGSANTPLWAGFIENIQFSSAIPSTPQVEDARLLSPSGFNAIYKAVEVGGYIYGVEWEGQYIYKFKISDNTFVKQSATKFTELNGICLSGDSSHLWVFDVSGGDTFVNKVDLEDMISEFSNTYDGTNVTYTDIHVTGNSASNRYLWASRSSGQLSNIKEDLITASATLSLTDRTPKSNTAYGTIGAWTDNKDCGANQTISLDPPRVCLIDIGTGSNALDRVGYCVRVKNESSTGAIFWQHTAGTGGTKGVSVQNASSSVDGKYCVFPIKYDQTTSNPLSNLYIVDSANVVATSEKVYSISTKGGAGGVITWGADSGLGSTEHEDFDADFNYDSDLSSALHVIVGIGDSPKTDELQSAYIFKHTSNTDYSGFEGLGSARWMKGTSRTNLAKVLETDVHLTFEQTAHDYGDGSLTPNAKIGFKANSAQFYKVSYLYDGYQESPLSDDFKFTGVTTDGKGVRVKIEVRNLANINRRISHLCLYRADADNVADLVEESGFYRLISVEKLDLSWAEEPVSGVWDNIRYKYITDNNIAGASYDARTGISEVLTATTPNYSLSTQLNNTHFIADIKQDSLGELNNYILKSKPLRFDQFNYVEDFLALPTKPTAIQGFNGRLYAFDKNNTYRIEPNNLYIEDIYEGVGCRNADSVIVTEYGMFFADKNNIYMHDGQKPHPIGNPILRGTAGNYAGLDNFRSNENWEALSANSFCKLSFDGKRNALLVFGRLYNTVLSDTQTWCWVYTIHKKRWDKWYVNHSSTVSRKPESLLSGTNGEVYYSDGTDLVQLAGHASTKENWTWYSKEISGGIDTVDKKFYEIYVGGTPSSTAGLVVDGGTITTSSPTEDGSVNYNKVQFTTKQGKKARIALSNQSGYVDSIGIIYRQLRVTANATV